MPGAPPSPNSNTINNNFKPNTFQLIVKLFPWIIRAQLVVTTANIQTPEEKARREFKNMYARIFVCGTSAAEWPELTQLNYYLV